MDLAIENLLPTLVSGVTLAAVAGIGLILVHLISQRIAKLVDSAEDVDDERRQQLSTIVETVKWGADVVIVGAVLLMLLSKFVDITPVLASAGVAGLAVSLGAQTLIKDLLGGAIILIENLYTVGDVIEVGDVAGGVERLTLRATHLRGIDGSLHVVPNGEVRIVSNITKDWSRAIVEIGVAYEEDLDRVLGLLEDEAQAFAEEPDVAPNLVGPPVVLGPLELGDWAVTIRVMLKTKPGTHWDIGRELKKRVLARMDREGVEMPYPRQEVLVRTLPGD
jgi:small conductance mechanosensitive channel